MPVTVKGIIENFLSMVERFGFVPNGGRVYYLSRSQPPLLIPMVRSMASSTSFEYKAHFSAPLSLSGISCFSYRDRANGEISLCEISSLFSFKQFLEEFKVSFLSQTLKTVSLPGREILRLYQGSRISQAKYSHS